MNKAEQTQQQDAIDLPQLARAIRFAIVGIILGLSYLSYRWSLSLEHFSQAFADMLGSQSLPTVTVCVLRTRHLFVTVSILVPVIAVTTLFLRGLVRSFYIIGVLGFTTTVQLVLLYHGLSAPLVQIVHGMSTP